MEEIQKYLLFYFEFEYTSPCQIRETEMYRNNRDGFEEDWISLESSASKIQVRLAPFVGSNPWQNGVLESIQDEDTRQEFSFF